MNALAQQKKRTLLFLAIVALACFALLPYAQAINPAPGGCYPAYTTAEGCNALSLLTSGAGDKYRLRDDRRFKQR